MDIPTLEELPTQFTAIVWVGYSPYSSELQVFTYDMSDQGYAMLGTVKLTVPVPQVDPREQMVKGLRQKREGVRIKCAAEVGEIDERIQELLALPAPDTVSDTEREHLMKPQLD